MFGFGKKAREKREAQRARAQTMAKRTLLDQFRPQLAQDLRAFTRFDADMARAFSDDPATDTLEGDVPVEHYDLPIRLAWHVMRQVVIHRIHWVGPDGKQEVFLKGLTETLPALAAENPAMRASLLCTEEEAQAIFATLNELDKHEVEISSQIVFDFIAICHELLDRPEGRTPILPGGWLPEEMLRAGLDSVYDKIEEVTGSTRPREMFGGGN